MARAEYKMVMVYLPIEERQYPTLLSLVQSPTPIHNLIDPFAGEGEFLKTAACLKWIEPGYQNLLTGKL